MQCLIPKSTNTDQKKSTMKRTIDKQLSSFLDDFKLELIVKMIANYDEKISAINDGLLKIFSNEILDSSLLNNYFETFKQELPLIINTN